MVTMEARLRSGFFVSDHAPTSLRFCTAKTSWRDVALRARPPGKILSHSSWREDELEVRRKVAAHVAPGVQSLLAPIRRVKTYPNAGDVFWPPDHLPVV
jgi:hypothetical protein